MTTWDRLRRDRALLLMAVPGIGLLLVFWYLPLLGNVVAFQDYLPYIGIADSPFTGLENFRRLFEDPRFWDALQNTLVLAFCQLVLLFPVPIALALLLNSVLSPGVRKLVQSVLYLPHFVSWVIVVALFQQVLGNAGVVNQFLRQHDLGTFELMTNPDLFAFLVTSQVIWKEAGWGTIIFLAALSTIDESRYESAAVDGAGPWRRLWHITLPGIRPIIVLLLILRLGEVLSVGFEQILLQRDAVGAAAAEVLDTYSYFYGVVGGEWGVAAAAGLFKGVVGLALILAANRVAHALGEQGVYSRER
ncbi:ABC transporter permease [Jiangella alkaliphila]|uniref:Carbohydrate ABC transporter membrane protein 1, CUT1 family n=1 Tax=Jiangella alkaliphila TaxID=419479 RepID=A0A1H2L3D6_9ACTN|nr:ABC transporter permease subunit [Jiangella alkaliphila]SDU75419.1 carbohydrate ABC transporter membrane protein 1, CUT1 family [Jiangella alkaliphila]